MTAQVTVLTTLVLSAAAGYFGYAAAMGVLMGGLAGALAFWILAWRVSKVATEGLAKVSSTAFRWMLFRMALYALVLYRAHVLDPDSHTGLLGAALGLLIVHAVMAILGVTGLDLKQEEK